jgi:Holliday junction resolvase-like predicted endonuclease
LRKERQYKERTGEEMACVLLKEQEYRILKRFYRYKIGKIDIVAKFREHFVILLSKKMQKQNWTSPVLICNCLKFGKLRMLGEHYLNH